MDNEEIKEENNNINIDTTIETASNRYEKRKREKEEKIEVKKVEIKKDNSSIRDRVIKKMKLDSSIDYPQCYLYLDNLLKINDKRAKITQKEREKIEKIYTNEVKNG